MDELKIFVQKVLPLVYDQSLSYYEVLGKVTNKINELIDYIEDGYRQEVAELLAKAFVNAVYNAEDESITITIDTSEVG